MTPRDNPKLLDEWRSRAAALSEEGLSFHRICLSIAARYSCSSATVRRYLSPAAAGRDRESDRLAKQRTYNRVRKKRLREKHFQRISRHPERYVPIAFQDRDQADLEAITASIREACDGVPFKPSTIEKRVLREYQWRQQSGTIRGPPPYLTQVDPVRKLWYYGDSPPEPQPS